MLLRTHSPARPMATQNVRIVGYLPPDHHKKLREYMKEQSLTESAAIVKIVKQFFDEKPSSNSPSPTSASSTLGTLKAEVAQLQQRLSLLEEAIAVGVVKKGSTSFTKSRARSLPILPPQNGIELARRFGVNPSSIEEAVEKGSDYFKDWSQRRDPASKAWQKRDDLFYPISE